MEAKICKSCGRELPLSEFANNSYGTPFATCRECIAEKKRITRYERTQVWGGVKRLPFQTRTSTI